MSSPAADIALYLENNSIGIRAGTSGWSIAVGTEPSAPTTAITIYDTGGGGPDTDQMDIFNPTFQVRVRSNLYPEGYTKAHDILLALVAMGVTTLNGSRYAFINAETDILSIGRDDNNKPIFTINFRAMRQ